MAFRDRRSNLMARNEVQVIPVSTAIGWDGQEDTALSE
jgi:hypothetical protein